MAAERVDRVVHLPGDSVRPLEKTGASWGSPAPQASVSRDLRELGAVWAEGHYEIPTWKDDGGNPLEGVLGFISGARAVADHFIFITTHWGAGEIVAQAVEACLSQDILGTHAGNNSVLVYTKAKDSQVLAFERLREYFEPADEEEEPPPVNGEPEPRREGTQLDGAENRLAAARPRMGEPYLR